MRPVEVGEEVLARWPDEGWYYRGNINLGSTWCVRFSVCVSESVCVGTCACERGSVQHSDIQKVSRYFYQVYGRHVDLPKLFTNNLHFHEKCQRFFNSIFELLANTVELITQ